MNTLTINELLNNFPHAGELIWIGLRPARNAPMISVDEVMLDEHRGLIGDRYTGRSGTRHVTLMQWEHIPVLESFARMALSPEVFRRNLMIKGINILALKGQQFRIGEAICEGTGYCHPCSKMEIKLGTGGYNTMRGHGGLTARVLKGELIKLGQPVIVC